MIYIEGKVIEQTEEESDDLGILMLIVEQDDGKNGVWECQGKMKLRK